MTKRFVSLFAAMFLAITLFSADAGSAQLMASGPPSVAAREQALNAIFASYWEDHLKNEPEDASSLGDKRYDDQLTDYSVAAYDARLASGRRYIEQLATIDPAGLADQVQLSRDLLLRELIEAQEEARYKTWELPVSQMGGIQRTCPGWCGS